MRILSIQATWVPPPGDLRADRFFLLSEHLEGDILHPVWYERAEQLEAEFGPGALPSLTRGRFHYHWFFSFKHRGRFQWLRRQWFYISKGLELHRKKGYDCIVVYSHMMPALAGVVLKLLTGAKLIVEIMTSPDLSYLYEHVRPTWGDRVLRVYSDFCLHLTVLASDRVHLLYKTQLDHYRMLRRVPASVFHDFVTVSLIPSPPQEHDRVVLFVGAPWYLKGVDILIQAFKKITDEFPDVMLRIQGHNPNSPELEAMAAGWPRIEIVKPVANPETLQRISRALVLAHPSRCEGMGRVLLEAMGAAVPVVGSDAGGIPSYIRHGENGFVFRSGDADELAVRLRELLGDAELRDKLGRKGYELAHTLYTERVYVEQYTRMVEAAVRGDE